MSLSWCPPNRQQARLTLNVLLSFAQFEREVTGERIRDKIAASKARGMWMGGVVPLGYDVCARKLIVVPDEADKVRHIFLRYLEIGSVYVLQAELADQHIRTKARKRGDGRSYGSAIFSRGALYQMLRNRIYLGEICHKGRAYPGEHAAIVDPDIFEQVSTLLDRNRNDYTNAVHADQPSLLCGILWDGEGRRMTPNHANKKGVRYRYYASCKDKERLQLPVWRVPAGDLEALVAAHVAKAADLIVMTMDRPWLRSQVERVTVFRDRIEIVRTGSDEDKCITVPAALISRSGERRLSVPIDDSSIARRDPALIKLIVNAHRARQLVTAGDGNTLAAVAAKMNVSAPYFSVLLRLSYLAPDITAAILDGRQPATLNRQRLARVTTLPKEWQGQRVLLGFA